MPTSPSIIQLSQQTNNLLTEFLVEDSQLLKHKSRERPTAFEHHHHLIFSTEMAEIPKLESGSPSSPSPSSSSGATESEQNRATQKTSASDHMDAFQYTPEKSDSFAIDMDAFPSTINKDTNLNSRITRNLSRKGFQRGGDKKINGNAVLHDRDTVPTAGSPKATLVGSCTPEKPGAVAVGSADHSTNSQVHHQITITASNISTPAATIEGKGVPRRNSFKRPSFRLLDPKRVLLFFATLSSMGTMLLIYFTLTISKQSDEYGVDWQQ